MFERTSNQSKFFSWSIQQISYTIQVQFEKLLNRKTNSNFQGLYAQNM